MKKGTALFVTMNVSAHAEAIKQAVSSSMVGFIEVGNRISEASTQLKEEDFSSLFDKSNENFVGMGERQGYRFLSISKGQKKLLKFQNDLPTDVTQLDAISRMTEKDIKSGINEDIISPEMGRGSLSKWLNPKVEIEVEEGLGKTKTIDIEAEDVTNVEAPTEEELFNAVEDHLVECTAYMIDHTPYDRKLQIVKGLIKKWEIKIEDLN